MSPHFSVKGGCGENTAPKALADLERFDASMKCDVMLAIGTSAVVQPSASFPVEAKSKGALVAEINIESTPLSSCADITLLGKAGDIVPRLVENWR